MKTNVKGGLTILLATVAWILALNGFWGWAVLITLVIAGLWFRGLDEDC